MKKKIRLFFKILFIFVFTFTLVRGIYLFHENVKLKRELKDSKFKCDMFYGQLSELSHIMLEINSDTPKKILFDSIWKYRQKMYYKFKTDSALFFEPEYYFHKNRNIIHGYHDELIFAFESDSLVDINYGDFKPNYRRLN